MRNSPAFCLPMLLACAALLFSCSREPMAPEVRQELKRLAKGEEEERQRAAQALGNMGEAALPAVPALIRACEQDEWGVRLSACTALGKIGDRRGVPPVIAVLEDNRNDTLSRRCLCETLARLGDPRAVRPLLKANMEDANRVAGDMAIRAIGSAATEPLLEAAADDADPDIRFTAIVMLRMLIGRNVIDPAEDPRILPAFLHALNDDSKVVRAAAAHALGRTRDEAAVEPLLAALHDESSTVRALAARSLGSVGGARAVTPLLAALEDRESGVVRSAVVALGRIGDARALDPLRAMLESEYRQDVIQALVQIGDPGVFDAILDDLESEDSSVRWRVARALTKLDDPRALPPLQNLLEEEEPPCDPFDIFAAVRRLQGCAEKNLLVEALHDEDGHMCARALHRLGELGEGGYEDVVAALEDERFGVRHAAVDALWRIGDVRAVEPLAGRLADADYRVRREAARALGALNDKRAIPPLIAALDPATVLPPNDQGFRDTVAEALRDLTGRNFGHLYSAWSTWWQTAQPRQEEAASSSTPAHAAAQGQSELSGLPLGHLEITEGQDGTVNVEARCVPTEQLLETLAERLGKPIVFDRSCRTYVSVWRPDDYRPVHFWLDFVASTGGRLVCNEKDNAVHVTSVELKSVYDCTLGESDIRQKYALSEFQPKAPRNGITKGLFIYRGRLIPSPYEVKADVNQDGITEILVNDVPVRRVPPVPPADFGPIPELPASGQFQEWEQLARYVMFRLYPSFVAEAGPARARQAVIAFLKSQDFLDSIVDPGGEITAYITYNGERQLRKVFPINYDYETGQLTRTRRQRTASQKAETLLQSLEQSLRHGNVVVRGKTGLVEFGGIEMLRTFSKAMSLAKDLPLLQAECVLAEVVEDRCVARELAANLGPDYGMLLAAVQRLGAER